MRRVFLYTLILFLGGVFSIATLHQYLADQETKIAQDAFKQKWDEKLAVQATELTTVFQTAYTSLRTMALLPGVKKIKDEKDFMGDAKVTAQQVYNNLASQVNISELYIVQADLDPDQIDPKTGKLGEPITTFDELIVGKEKNENESQTQAKESEKLEEVEIEEYRQMKLQLDFLKQKFSSVQSIDGLKYPALVSEEVITCDNTEFSKNDLMSHNDFPRRGIIYSVPFYDEEGRLRGMISGVFRTAVLSRLISEPYFILTLPSTHYEVLSPQAPPLVSHYGIQEKSAFIYENTLDLDFPSQTVWKLRSFIPQGVWQASDEYASVQEKSHKIWMTGFLVLIPSSILIFSIFYARARALQLAEQMTRAYQETHEQLLQSQKLESIGKLAGGIAHDFNNIICGIMGNASLLLEDTSIEPSKHKKLTTILKSAERAAQLTKQLLGFARKGKYEKKSIFLNEIVDEVVQMLSHTIHRKINIKTNLDPELWRFEGDSSQLIQVLMNLGVNASDAMPDGGELIFETENVVVDEMYAKAHAKISVGSYVCIKVSDTGSGISPEIREKIFDPFFTTKEVGKGTGLGLSMVYGIVQNHGGNIHLYSELGKGSLFQICFPATTSSVLPEERNSLKSKNEINDFPDLKGQTILIVDDESVMRDLAQMVLEKTGATLVLAGDGEEALSVFQKLPKPPALIIMDAIMPRMGGIEAYQKIAEKNPTQPVIFCSGYSESNEISKLRQKRHVSFIQKPFQAFLLLEKVSEFLGHVRDQNSSTDSGITPMNA